MTKKRWFLVLAAVGVIAIGTLITISALSEDTVAVHTSKVERKSITQTVQATGKVEPVQKVEMSAYVSAEIVELPVEEGDPVKKGDLLAKLDSTRYRANRDQAYAAQKAAASQVEMVRANLEQARRTYDRTVKLHQQELVSDEALENARTQVEALEAQLQSAVDDVGRAGANLRLTSDDVSKTVLRAPIDGIIISLKKEIGEIVMGSQLTRDVIMTVADMSKMEIVVEVDENDVPDLRLGQTARITVDAFPDQKFEGTVTQIANSAKVVGFGTQEETTSFDVTVTLRGDVSAIRPGMSATADIETATHDDVLAVPIQCLTMRDPEADPEKDLAHVRSDKLKDVVFKVADNRSALAVVTTGIASEFDMEIAGETLAEGDEVVCGPYKTVNKDLKDGDLLEIGDETAVSPDNETS